jgi:hypothetical protein
MQSTYAGIRDDAQALANHHFVERGANDAGSFWTAFDLAANNIKSRYGIIAFMPSKTDAAYHAIGQCVVFAAQNIAIDYARIIPIGEFEGQSIWVGIAGAARPPWRPGEDIDGDFREMNYRLAGSVSELHFARGNYKHGSHLGNQVLAGLIARSITERVDCDPEKFFPAQVEHVREIIVANESMTWALAQSLADGKLGTAALNETLSRVVRP